MTLTNAGVMFYLNIDEIIKRVNVLLHQPLHLKDIIKYIIVCLWDNNCSNNVIAKFYDNKLIAIDIF